MAEVPDRGNPNFFALFNGSHVAQLAGSSSTSNVFMLTSMNTVQFLGDCTAGADGRMWVLPEECRPKNPVRFMCPIEPTGDVPGASYEVVVDVTAESKAVEVVTGIATGTSKALTEATLATETANAAAGVELATETANAVATATLSTETANAVAGVKLTTETANAVAGVKLTTKSVPNLVSSPSAMTGAGLTVGQYDGLVGTPALSSATMTETTAKVLSKASLQTTTAEVLSKGSLQTTTAKVLSKGSLQTEEGDFLVSATAVSGSMEVAGMPNVKKSVIKVPDTPGSTFAVVTVMPDGTISGEPGVLHYTNGHMFSISDNWYLEG
uniref:Uncharacterized protein n=1 Tax=Podoviridae sp. ctiHu16 TaxID=2826571 RepID=A0A8S5MPD4_9CAUD|nr:MAG TPA: hypothetical protein [Podoviridae sp. ctiHu16]